MLKDRKGYERDGRVVAFLYSGGQVYEIDPRAVWDLELDEREEREVDTRLLLTGKELTEKELTKKIEELKKALEEKVQKIKELTKDSKKTLYEGAREISQKITRVSG